MAEVQLLRLPAATAPAEFWPALAGCALGWLQQRQLPVRDAVLLLPFAELLAPARRAFAAVPGWQPRIETQQTLAASLGPPAVAAPGECSLDAAMDRLSAAELLRSQAGLGGWQRRDPLAFDDAVSALVVAAHTLLRGVAGVAPDARAVWWQQARQALPASVGASAMATLLAQVALEWAALSPPPASDRLLALRPSAWLVLSAGDANALADPWHSLLLAQAGAQGLPCLHLSADAAGEQPFEAAAAAGLAAPELWCCDDAEQEALAAASAVLWALADAPAPTAASDALPVALIAEDRLLVRRTRALLERAGVAVADESGWTLDTTRAGARVLTLLRAAHPAAGDDARLDWLKADLGGAHARWLDRLERRWRRGQAFGATPAQASALDAEVDRQWAQQQARLQALAGPGARPLPGWLAALRQALLGSPQARHWAEDAAGREVWQALRLDSVTDGLSIPAVDGPAAQPMALDGFSRWVDAALADAHFRPAAAGAQVVVTPMARAMLRPFARVVLPGADERHLGPPAPGPSLLGDAVLRQLGLADAAQRGQRLARCFVQLLRQPGTLLLRRRADGDEPLAASPWVARLNLARRARGLAPVVEQPAPLARRRLAATPVLPPMASAAAALPAQLSASALQALRACPYRFFGRSVLGLAQPDELEADPGKRDYGSWLHAALHRFHQQRLAAGDAGAPPDTDTATEQLLAAAQAVATEQGLDTAALLPFQAGLRAFAGRYLEWLAGHEATGWRYALGEAAATAAAPGVAGLRLVGRIDRVDHQPHAPGAEGPAEVVMLLDYKTGSLAGLKQQLRDPLEDTQLAFYAAQVLAGGLDALDPSALSVVHGAYLALDDRQAVVLLPHLDLATSARALLDGLADEWPRMAAGEPLRALGEGSVCEHCEVRGLCRRDHWSAGQRP